MEDTLRDNKHIYPNECERLVLILVLMEDTLRENGNLEYGAITVLILVLMEDTLRA